MTSQRELLSFLDRHPFIDALLEIVSIVLFALMPILIAAFISITSAPEFSAKDYISTLYKFLSDGEFVILTIALCGSIFWLGVVKLQKIDGLLKFLFIFLPVAGLAFPISVSLLDRIKNADDPIPEWLFWITFFIYLMCLIAYLWALYVEKTQGRPGPDPSENNAEQILTAAGKTARVL